MATRQTSMADAISTMRSAQSRIETTHEPGAILDARRLLPSHALTPMAPRSAKPTGLDTGSL